MPSPTEITVSQLSRLIGLPTAPAIVVQQLYAPATLAPRHD